MKTRKILVIAPVLAGLVSFAVAGPNPDWIASRERVRKEQQARQAKAAAEKAHGCTKTCACDEMRKK